MKNQDRFSEKTIVILGGVGVLSLFVGIILLCGLIEGLDIPNVAWQTRVAWRVSILMMIVGGNWLLTHSEKCLQKWYGATLFEDELEVDEEELY